MADHQTWTKVLRLIASMEEPLVVVSATARTTRELVRAAECASRGDVGQAMTVVRGIEQRHLHIVQSFAEELQGDHVDAIASCDRYVADRMDELRRDLTLMSRDGGRSNGGRGNGSSDMHSGGVLDVRTAELMDRVAGTGELLSSYLLTQCGKMAGLPLEFVDSRTVVKTDDTFGAAVPDEERSAVGCGFLVEMIRAGRIPVLGGYIGEAPGGQSTTLGFEGSDVTATFLGGLTGASKVTIWTDVDGIYSCDPRVVPAAVRLDQLPFEGAERMAKCGAKVLHPNTLQPVSDRGIPVFVRNLFAPEGAGTRISGRLDGQGRWGFSAIAFMPEVRAGGAEKYAGYRVSVIGLMPERWRRVERHVGNLVIAGTSAGSSGSSVGSSATSGNSSEISGASAGSSGASAVSGLMSEKSTDHVTRSRISAEYPGMDINYDDTHAFLSLWMPDEEFEDRLRVLYHLTCE